MNWTSPPWSASAAAMSPTTCAGDIVWRVRLGRGCLYVYLLGRMVEIARTGFATPGVYRLAEAGVVAGSDARRGF